MMRITHKQWLLAIALMASPLALVVAGEVDLRGNFGRVEGVVFGLGRDAVGQKEGEGKGEDGEKNAGFGHGEGTLI